MPRRYRLFHLDSERGFRGGERQLLYLAAHLRERGHDNVVVCRRGDALDDEARRQGFDTLNLPFLFEWDPWSAWLLAREAARRGGAVLHAHTGHTAALARLAAAFRDLPRIVHRRVDFRLKSSLSRRLKYESADRVVAVSESVRGVLAEDGLDPDRVTVIPDCLPVTGGEARAVSQEAPLSPPSREEARDARRRLALELDLPPEGPWIGNLAALVPHKDQATLLRAARRVLEKRPGARFILFGAGPLLGGLKALVGELGIEDSVRFAGFREDPALCLAALDLYVQSSWGEGMGSVLLEVMARGVPIVGTTAGGIPEVVENGRTALLVPPRSPEKLAGAIEASLSDALEAGRRAAAAGEALKGFGLARLGDKMIGVYDDAARPAVKEETAPGAAASLSVTIITHNEGLDLPGCLRSVEPLGAEIIVMDNLSDDRTREIARRFTPHVFERPFQDFASQKQAAADRASGDWVLSIDADERLTPGLVEEIRKVLAAPPAGIAGFDIPFEVHFMGRHLRFGGLGGESHIRLFRRDSGRFTGGRLHEGIEVDGKTARLTGSIRHIPYRDLDEYLEKMRIYTTNSARKKLDARRRFTPFHHLLPLWEFFARTILRLGALDGTPGIVWAGLSAFHSWLKYVKLRDLSRAPASGRKPAGPAPDRARTPSSEER